MQHVRSELKRAIGLEEMFKIEEETLGDLWQRTFKHWQHLALTSAA
jgi:hypothetical protein